VPDVTLTATVEYSSVNDTVATNRVYAEVTVSMESDAPDVNLYTVVLSGPYTFCVQRSKLTLTFYVDNNGAMYPSKPTDLVKQIQIGWIRDVAESVRIYADGYVADKSYSYKVAMGSAVAAYEARGRNSRYGIKFNLDTVLGRYLTVLETIYLYDRWQRSSISIKFYSSSI